MLKGAFANFYRGAFIKVTEFEYWLIFIVIFPYVMMLKCFEETKIKL